MREQHETEDFSDASSHLPAELQARLKKPDPVFEVDLTHRDGLGVFGVMMASAVLFALVGAAVGEWLAVPVILGVFGVPIAFALLSLSRTRGDQLRIESNRAQVIRAGRALVSVSLDSVNLVQRRDGWFGGQHLQFVASDGTSAEILLPTNDKTASVVPLLVHFLGPRVPWERGVRSPRGPRSRYIILAAVYIPLGVLCYHLTLARVSEGSSALWLAIASVGAFTAAAINLGKLAIFSPKRAGVRYKRDKEVAAGNLLVIVEALREGKSLPGKRAFAYPEQIREFDTRAEERRVRIGKGFLIGMPLVILGLAAVPAVIEGGGILIVFGILGFALVSFFSFIGYMLMRANFELKQVLENRFDSVLVDEDAVSVLRGSVHHPAQIVQLRKNNQSFKDMSGLNVSRLLLEVDGHRYWYDPSQMIEVDRPGQVDPDVR